MAIGRLIVILRRNTDAVHTIKYLLYPTLSIIKPSFSHYTGNAYLKIEKKKNDHKKLLNFRKLVVWMSNVSARLLMFHKNKLWNIKKDTD